MSADKEDVESAANVQLHNTLASCRVISNQYPWQQN